MRHQKIPLALLASGGIISGGLLLGANLSAGSTPTPPEPPDLQQAQYLPLLGANGNVLYNTVGRPILVKVGGPVSPPAVAPPAADQAPVSQSQVVAPQEVTLPRGETDAQKVGRLVPGQTLGPAPAGAMPAGAPPASS